jgi:hypothetical protein
MCCSKRLAGREKGFGLKKRTGGNGHYFSLAVSTRFSKKSPGGSRVEF